VKYWEVTSRKAADDRDLLSDGKSVRKAGATVRRPRRPWSAAVLTLLQHLAGAGFSGAPKPVGTGIDGPDEVVEFVVGDVDAARVWGDDAIFALGQLLHDLHDAAASFEPPPNLEWQASYMRSTDTSAVVSHGDIAPWNVVARDGLPVAFIDWEHAGPVRRLHEVAQACWLNARLFDDYTCEVEGSPPARERVSQVRAFVDGYGLSRHERANLVDLMIDVAVLSCANDAVEADVTPHHTTDVGLIWGMAWRARSADWLVRHREELERTIR